jgi:regulatory protein YycI of two-component signal transduction system YycFG
MIKLKDFFVVIIALLAIALIWIFVIKNIELKKQNKILSEQNMELLVKNSELNENLKRALDKTAISFSINPAITNKVTSAFGSTKNVTLQYYFTLDGKAIIAKPDSVYTVVKEY